MKKSLSLFILFLVCSLPYFSHAQLELWGMCSEGGYSKGVIFKTDSAGENFSVQHYFENREKNPKGSLMKASNGHYYAMSDNGGRYGLGCIFEYDPSDDSVFILHHFDGDSTGSHPKGDLLEASNGKLYGMTNTGGTGNNRGVVFELDLTDNCLTKIYEFGEWPKGRLPVGSLIQATNGKLYGMTRDGGNIAGGGYGTIFEIDLSGPTLTILYTFTGGNIDGSHPLGNLLQVNDSLLYGYTPEGGVNNQGTVFKFNIDLNIHTKLFDFDGISGTGPRGSPVKATDGSLYGVFNSGVGDSYSGGIFEYDIDDSTLMVEHEFGWNSGHPSTGGVLGSLYEGKANTLYGITNRGGANDDGVLFKYDCITGTLTSLHNFSFSINNNQNVYGSVIESSAGVLIGLTQQGGSTTKGTIFEFDTTSLTYTTKHNFNSYSHGETPKGSLMACSNGKLYGLTSSGGSHNVGVLFEFDPFTQSYQKLHDFNGVATGANPQGSLIEASNGKLYGLTMYGGNDGQGTIFEFDLITNMLTKEHDFGWAPSAGQPVGSLLQASDGKLYGLTSFGGAGNYGVVFSFDITTKTYNKETTFTIASGSNPKGNLIEAATGKLYGLTFSRGATGHGSIFKYEISTGILTDLFHFDNVPNGREATGDLLLNSRGKLYGMASKGGSSGTYNGVLFQYDMQSASLTVVHEFNVNPDGINPFGSLTESSNGKLYGLTSSGGINGYNDKGVLFELDTVSNVYTKKVDFHDTTGYKPIYTKLLKLLVHADWTGMVSTDWNDPGNWLQNVIPSSFTEVRIPDVSTSSGNFPIINSDILIRNLLLDEHANISISSGFNLKVGYP